MGWTTKSAFYFKNGKVDRLQEVRDMWEVENEGRTRVLKMVLVGSVVYGAIQNVNTGVVWGLVVLTSVEGKEFSYKDMDDTCGPYYFDCPLSILKLLTPTDNENANNWRKSCYKRVAENRQRAKLSRLPVGTVIEFVNEIEMSNDTGTYKREKGEIVRLIRCRYSNHKNLWCDNYNGKRVVRWKVQFIPASYHVVAL